jgi:hypothetical protein
MSSFELIEPFETSGSLGGLSDEMCFALGVEWAMFRAKLATGVRFSDLVICHNADRLVRMVERQRRFVEHHPHCDGWTEIIVGDYVV